MIHTKENEKRLFLSDLSFNAIFFFDTLHRLHLILSIVLYIPMKCLIIVVQCSRRSSNSISLTEFAWLDSGRAANKLTGDLIHFSSLTSLLSWFTHKNRGFLTMKAPFCITNLFHFRLNYNARHLNYFHFISSSGIFFFFDTPPNHFRSNFNAIMFVKCLLI